MAFRALRCTFSRGAPSAALFAANAMHRNSTSGCSSSGGPSRDDVLLALQERTRRLEQEVVQLRAATVFLDLDRESGDARSSDVQATAAAITMYAGDAAAVLAAALLPAQVSCGFLGGFFAGSAAKRSRVFAVGAVAAWSGLQGLAAARYVAGAADEEVDCGVDGRDTCTTSDARLVQPTALKVLEFAAPSAAGFAAGLVFGLRFG
ncbi:hypothetical protein M885DRAFT_558404 [Pelagophyceae sp. CCMP2097]|nr:hypothetical protein M885DRAFT_558404 [Pelagophyceae sp. CCMP2097]